MQIRYLARAATRIRIVSNWWFENRPEHPALFDEELLAAEQLLLQQPTLGRVFRRVRGEEIRQYLLEGTQQWVFYSVQVAEGFLTIHTVWGARRGAAPEL